MNSLRLRILIICLILGLLGLFARAWQVQYLQKDKWTALAQKRLEDVESIETTRGRILDYRGRELAVEAACLDVVVDYRAITNPPDEAWVREIARGRLRTRLGEAYSKAPSDRRGQLLDEQILQVKQDIEQMWQMLGNEKLTGVNAEQIEERRRQIVQRVQMRQRYLWYANYVEAEKKQTASGPSAWWAKWLSEGNSTELQLNSFDVEVKEQKLGHVVLSAAEPELANYLGKNLERFPGLELRPGQHRSYPYGATACQVLGYLSHVNDKDIKEDPARGEKLRHYEPDDLIGRGGVEKLCEQTLRGSRGLIRRSVRNDQVLEAIDAVPGGDVRLTIDVKLQQHIEEAFAHTKVEAGGQSYPLHGAAVLIDVPTGQVRAMVSYPTYDPNELDRIYGQLVKDDINHPLMNRATQAQLEPGSTVKPMLGLAGITEKVVGVYEGIECTGYLVIRGTTYRKGKCWVVARTPWDPMHHHIPFPHVGTHGNPDGFLTYSEALERSCNVWCETVADRLGLQRIHDWYGQFGLGQPTGIGIGELPGRLPNPQMPGPAIQRMQIGWSAGIGQGHVNATPIQMANVAATIARDGLWMRPTLVAEGALNTSKDDGPSTRQLKLDPEALVACKQGMIAVVNSRAGSGQLLRRNDMVVAGKTGTAQAALFSVPEYDAQGHKVMVDGHEKRRFLEPSTSTRVNPEAPWYRGTGKNESELNHAWFIGFAPADHPQVAFAAMVEYGGGGGTVAGGIAKAILDVAEQEGYLAPSKP